MHILEDTSVPSYTEI